MRCRPDRRAFLIAVAGCAPLNRLDAPDAIIDIHQHVDYSGRTDEALVAHQRALGITRTVLLPAGSRFGLAAGCGGNTRAAELAARFPGEYLTFANELPDLPETRPVIERWLRAGARGIGEQKFPVDADSPAIETIASIARDFRVPVLLHFEEGRYNMKLERFRRILEKFPSVTFIGHAISWWGNVDKAYDPSAPYPKGKIVAGGLTDRLLADFPNMFGDLSAGSGLNALTRDEDHARGFLDRHQDKLIFGSDCSDSVPFGELCLGGKILAAVRRLAPGPDAVRKMFAENARKVLKL